jgi:hypothetical protein
MNQPKATTEEILAAHQRHGGSTIAIAREFGMSPRSVQLRLRRLGIQAENPEGGAPKRLFPKAAPQEFTVADLPDDDIDVEQLVEHRIRQFERKKARHDATRLIPVKVRIDGPIGLLMFGDPHVDDDGTDLETLRKHSDLTQLEAVWGCNIGDSQNLWTGRLARLYAEQSTSASQAWKLVEWFINRTRWLWLIGGNHDLWAGAGDPLKWICRQKGVPYQSSEIRIALHFPNGRQVLVNARHDFAGHSQWNPAHGVMKAATMGVRDHLLVSGHKHVSGYGVLRDPDTGRACHAVQIASYKLLDRYAQEKGFRDQSLSPCAFIVIDPRHPDNHPDLVKVFWDPEIGVEYLHWLRANAVK